MIHTVEAVKILGKSCFGIPKFLVFDGQIIWSSVVFMLTIIFPPSGEYLIALLENIINHLSHFIGITRSKLELIG